jgi:hypothetical protein
VSSIEASADNDDNNGDKTVSNRILEPTLRDVLCGRGRPFQNHPGNLRFREIVNRHKKAYLSSPRCNKLDIANDVVDEIKKKSEKDEAVRFLKRSKDYSCWLEVSDDIAREKACHALRSKPQHDAASGPGGLKRQIIEHTDLSESQKKKHKLTEIQDESATTFPPSSFIRAHHAMTSRSQVLEISTNQASSSPTINPFLTVLAEPNVTEVSPLCELARSEIYARRERAALAVYFRERAVALLESILSGSSDGSGLQRSQYFRPGPR